MMFALSHVSVLERAERWLKEQPAKKAIISTEEDRPMRPLIRGHSECGQELQQLLQEPGRPSKGS